MSVQITAVSTDTFPLQLVLVTEPIILSLANVLSEYDRLPAAVAAQHHDVKMSELERKHGLLQVGMATLAHDLRKESCPQHILVT